MGSIHLFQCPSSILALKDLARRSRRVLWVCLGLGTAVHLLLTQITGSDAKQEVAKPLTTHFVKRQPRLTKPLELKKRPRPKRRALQRAIVFVGPRSTRQSASSGLRPGQMLQGLTRPNADITRTAASIHQALEPSSLSQAVLGKRQAAHQVDMSLEMIDIDALDTGQYQAMVVQDPTDKRNIRGYLHLAVVYSVSMGKGKWTNSDPRRIAPMANLVKALNRWTDIKADLSGVFTFDHVEIFSTPWVYAAASSGPFVCTAGELRSIGRYLTSGGFLVADGDPYLNSAGDLSIRRMLREGLASQGIVWGHHWTFQRLPDSHPVYHCYFDFPHGPPTAGDFGTIVPNPGMPRTGGNRFLEGIRLGHRLVAIMANKFFQNAWGDWGPDNRSTLGHAGIYYKDLDPTRPLQFGVNMIIFALTQEGSITHRVMDSVAY